MRHLVTFTGDQEVFSVSRRLLDDQEELAYIQLKCQ